MPIFYWKLRLRFLTNANEMDTNNLKYTWPSPAPHVGDPTQPIFPPASIGGNTNLAFPFGVMQILAFLDTNMLGVYALGV